MLGWLALRWATKHTGKDVSEIVRMSPEQEGNHCNLCRKSFFAEISTEALRRLSSRPNMWGQFFYRPYRWCAWQTEREGCRLIASCQTASLPRLWSKMTLFVLQMAAQIMSTLSSTTRAMDGWNGKAIRKWRTSMIWVETEIGLVAELLQPSTPGSCKRR